MSLSSWLSVFVFICLHVITVTADNSCGIDINDASNLYQQWQQQQKYFKLGPQPQYQAGSVRDQPNFDSGMYLGQPDPQNNQPRRVHQPRMLDQPLPYEQPHHRHSDYYDNDTSVNRTEVFHQNLCHIEQLNNITNKSGAAVFVPGKYADLTPTEFKRLLGGLQKPKASTPNKKRETQQTFTQAATPSSTTSINWCTNGYCSPIKDQGSCGSCWAYSSTSAYESAIAIALNTPNDVPVYSPQFLIDCNAAGQRPCNPTTSCYTSSGCGGGYAAFDYIENQGHFLLSNYPYSSSLNQGIPCAHLTGEDNKLTAWGEPDDTITEDQMAANVALYGPSLVMVDADNWQNYKSGIMTASQCGSGATDHAVVIVGFDATTWTIRNSWGSDWGESGFITLERGTGACSLSGYAFPLPSGIPSSSSNPPPPPPPPTPTEPVPTTVVAVSSCEESGCLPFPVTLFAYTLTSCSNIPDYGLSSPYGVCIVSVDTSSNSFTYYECPSSCGTPPTLSGAVSSSAGGSGNPVAGSLASPQPSNSEQTTNVPLIVGLCVGLVLLTVVIVVVVFVVKSRASAEQV